MPYDEYLAIWKTKGKVPLVPAPTPTATAAASTDSVSMPIAAQAPKAAVKTSVKAPNTANVKPYLGNMKKAGFTKTQYTHTGQVYGGGQKHIPGYESIVKMSDGKVWLKFSYDVQDYNIAAIGKKMAYDGWYVKVKGKNIYVSKDPIPDADFKPLGVNSAPNPATPGSATSHDVAKASDTSPKVTSYKPIKKAAAAPPKSPSTPGVATPIQKQEFMEKVGALYDDALDGKYTAKELAGKLDELVAANADVAKQVPLGLDQIAQDMVDDFGWVWKAKPGEYKAPDLIQTHMGPLDHNLAQEVYKAMKAHTPGGTPAQWRHAAADYLKVDYNDYLAAWKKPSGLPKPPPASKMPKTSVNQTPTMSPTTAGKYNKEISVDQLKDELATLYGPGAQKNYINITRNSDGSYSTQFPSSILSPAGKQAVSDALEKMGLKVTKTGNTYKIMPKKPVKVEAGDKVIDANGVKVLNQAVAEDDTTAWWDTLSETEKSAWRSYTGSGYAAINRRLRTGDGKITPTMEALSRTMEKTTEEFVVRRGGSYPAGTFTEGALWRDKGFMSTAIRGGGFGGNTKLVITVSKGTKGHYIGTKSSHQHENEYLLDKGTRFRVVRIDGHTVYLTTVP